MRFFQVFYFMFSDMVARCGGHVSLWSKKIAIKSGWCVNFDFEQSVKTSIYKTYNFIVLTRHFKLLFKLCDLKYDDPIR